MNAFKHEIDPGPGILMGLKEFDALGFGEAEVGGKNGSLLTRLIGLCLRVNKTQESGSRANDFVLPEAFVGHFFKNRLTANQGA